MMSRNYVATFVADLSIDHENRSNRSSHKHHRVNSQTSSSAFELRHPFSNDSVHGY